MVTIFNLIDKGVYHFDKDEQGQGVEGIEGILTHTWICITFIIKWGIELFTRSQTWTNAPLKFVNG